MLYGKKAEPVLREELFRNPTAEFRGAPFWSWNTKLEKAELLRQIEIFKEMGIGGFHIHSRSGLATPYLGDEFMELVSACNEKAKQEGMLCWLYDEDRWPSGAAGGIVTRNYRYRAQHLVFEKKVSRTPRKLAANFKEFCRLCDEGQKPAGYVLCEYSVTLDEDGFLREYHYAHPEDPAESLWCASVLVGEDNPWYNDQAYLDTMNKAAVEEFIRVTYDRYAQVVGKDFGGSIPAIFTDEPQVLRHQFRAYSMDMTSFALPYTGDFDETYRVAYGVSFFDTLPEMFWNTRDEACMLTRYRYYNHMTERFVSAFVDTIGQWCEEHGIAFTGHMIDEPSLNSQTCALGEAMRCYRSFHIPGMDMLCDRTEYTTAKQVQSAVRQYGREGMLSELYGVTGWDFDFKGHKRQGDWQAALGVTVRVHHLTWVSMNGEAKRDYPASIGYQSAWYRQYHHVEDHFARLNTVLTRGTPDVRVAVIHPIESFWMFTGPNDKTGARRAYLNQQFVAVTNSLVFGGVDFDFISEALLPQLCETASNPLKVGAMSYSCVIVPMVETLRSTTLERLNAFTKAGGRVIILGRPPRFVDARPSDEAVKAAENWNILNVDYTALLEALEPERFVNFINEATGYRCGNILYQLRQDTDGKWLFFCHGENIEKQPGIKPVTWSEKTCVTIKGDWDITEYNTMTGEIYRPAYEVKRGNTLFRRTLFAQDSVLLHLSPSTKGDRVEPGNMPYRPMPYGMQDTILKRSSLKSASSGKALKPADPVPYSLDEPNALILDKARFAFDGEAYSSDEMDCFLIADEGRKRFYENHQEQRIVQPWVPIPEELKNSPDHTVSRLFSVDSDIWVENAHLALEDSEEAVILVNGKEISNASDGWYVDRCIHTVPLPPLQPGRTTIEIRQPFRLRTCTEWCYIVGDFGVNVIGRFVKIVKRAENLAYGDAVHQTLPFYTGNITYHCRFNEAEGGRRTIQLPNFAGALATVSLDGDEERLIMLSPFVADLGEVSKGLHTLDIKVYGTRINGFGPVHDSSAFLCQDPGAWRTHHTPLWSDVYQLRPTGLLSAPLIY